MTAQQIQQNLQFKNSCVLNLSDIESETPIYRVYPIDRILELFTSKKNTLTKPKCWDDPFENMIFKQKVSLKNGEIASLHGMGECYYGQCWTLNTVETDALWRIYSPNKNGVRIKTTFKKLWDGYYNPYHKLAQISYFIGKVKYETSDEIQKFFEDPNNLKMIFDSTGKGSVQTLLIKRTEFEHENELRLIYFGNKDDDDLTKNIYQYDIDPENLIDELLFDPRFDEVDSFKRRQEQIKYLEFSKILEKSTLYQLPNFNLQLDY